MQRALGAAAELAAFRTSVMAEKLEKAAGAVQRTGYEAACRGLSTCNSRYQTLLLSLKLPVWQDFAVFQTPLDCEAWWNQVIAALTSGFHLYCRGCNLTFTRLKMPEYCR